MTWESFGYPSFPPPHAPFLLLSLFQEKKNTWSVNIIPHYFLVSLFIFLFMCCIVLLEDEMLVDNIWVDGFFVCVQGNGPKCILCKGYISEDELRGWRRRRRRRRKCFMFLMMCFCIALLDWKWCLCKLSETTLTWRQMVMLCVTGTQENWKSIQKANNFMEKHIIRPL